MIQAARELTIEKGWGNFSLEAVAHRVGVSKGGLIHHFPNKQALLDAISDQIMEYLDSHIRLEMENDPEPEGKLIRAYLSMSLLPDDDPNKNLMMAAYLTGWKDERSCQRWNEWIENRLAESRRYVRDMIVKYAADGLWHEHIMGDKLSPKMRTEIIKRLIEITKIKEEPINEKNPE